MTTDMNTSKAEIDDAHEYIDLDRSELYNSAPKHKVILEKYPNKMLTHDIALCHTYLSRDSAINEQSLGETDLTDADGYLVPNIKPGSLAEDPGDYHSYNYPDLVAREAPTTSNIIRNTSGQPEGEYLELDESLPEDRVSKSGQTPVYQTRIRRI